MRSLHCGPKVSTFCSTAGGERGTENASRCPLYRPSSVHTRKVTRFQARRSEAPMMRTEGRCAIDTKLITAHQSW